jgi:hypothetical protein
MGTVESLLDIVTRHRRLSPRPDVVISTTGSQVATGLSVFRIFSGRAFVSNGSGIDRRAVTDWVAFDNIKVSAITSMEQGDEDLLLDLEAERQTGPAVTRQTGKRQRNSFYDRSPSGREWSKEEWA